MWALASYLKYSETFNYSLTSLTIKKTDVEIKMQKLLVFLLFVGIFEVPFGQAFTSDITIKQFFKEIGNHSFTNNLGQRQLKTYYASRSVKLSWANAFSFCKANDMNLVELETEYEANNFLKMCTDQNLEHWYHIGGSYEGSDSLYDYYWMTTGEKVSYTLSYYPGEPNGQNKEKCLAIGKQPIKYGFCDVGCYGNDLSFCLSTC
ncbi:unnamed protein product [Diamesa serratosioi]